MVKFIALIGHPKSGKSEVQKIISELYRAMPVDDGAPLRDMAMKYLNLSYNDVHTQEGKDKIVSLCGHRMEVRQFLGRLGNAMEREFGEYALPEMAMNSTKTMLGDMFTFGSVRKGQGWCYKQHGGLVIEVVRPGVGPSGNDFDRYDPKSADIAIHNNFVGDDWYEQLKRHVAYQLEGVFRNEKTMGLIDILEEGVGV
jgi:hypothetical protein